MAITFFGVNSNPADNGTSVATTIAVTPPASMVSGDLVLFYGYQRGSATISVSATGGQTWSTAAFQTSGGLTMAAGLFWCVYNGTWGTDPSLAYTAGTNTNAVMIVFRPSASGNSWSLDSTSTTNGFDNSASATTHTIAWGGFTNPTLTSYPSVAMSSWMSDDDNTWGTLTGSGWSKTGLAAQYRNTSGNDVSSTYAYNILTSGSPASAAQTQAANGPDPAFLGHFIFYEFTPAPSESFDPMGTMGFFGL